jgi:S4 domain protein YaaA
MDYKLFDEYITLQSLLKTTGILPSGGAIKGFLAENLVLYNGEKEDRRGKKIRIGDRIDLPDQGLSIQIIAPSQEERDLHQEDQAEKERVAKMVKEMNKQLKKDKKEKAPSARKEKEQTPKKAPVRFPGT